MLRSADFARHSWNAATSSLTRWLSKHSLKCCDQRCAIGTGLEPACLRVCSESHGTNGENVRSVSRNYGKVIAMTVGLDYAAGDAAVIDADRQDPADASEESRSLFQPQSLSPNGTISGFRSISPAKDCRACARRGYLGALRRQDATSSSPHTRWLGDRQRGDGPVKRQPPGRSRSSRRRGIYRENSLAEVRVSAVVGLCSTYFNPSEF
jgi:hypothetical protein